MFPDLGKDQPKLENIYAFDVVGLEGRFDETNRDHMAQLWARLAEIAEIASFAASDRIGISENNSDVMGGVLGYVAALPHTLQHDHAVNHHRDELVRHGGHLCRSGRF